jgi:hypothetical protein
MPTIGRGFLLAALATAAALSFDVASAGEVYKCKGPHGEVTFTNIKCPDKTAAEHYGSYTKAPDAPSVSGDAASSPESSPELAEPGTAAIPETVPATSASATAGYECGAEGKAWIQLGPCPLTSTKTVFEDVWLDDGGSGTVERKVTVPVQQTELGPDAMCNAISARENVTEKGDNGPSASYERNRMREAVGCH